MGYIVSIVVIQKCNAIVRKRCSLPVEAFQVGVVAVIRRAKVTILIRVCRILADGESADYRQCIVETIKVMSGFKKKGRSINPFVWYNSLVKLTRAC